MNLRETYEKCKPWLYYPMGVYLGAGKVTEVLTDGKWAQHSLELLVSAIILGKGIFELAKSN